MSEPADWTSGVAALLVSECGACKTRWYLPRDACPKCGSASVERRPAAGVGVVRASTTLHRVVAGSVDDGPVGFALVDLDEGVRVLARCIPGTSVGERVRARFATCADGSGPPVMLPVFEVVAP